MGFRGVWGIFRDLEGGMGFFGRFGGGGMGCFSGFRGVWGFLKTRMTPWQRCRKNLGLLVISVIFVHFGAISEHCEQIIIIIIILSD